MCNLDTKVHWQYDSQHDYICDQINFHLELELCFDFGNISRQTTDEYQDNPPTTSNTSTSPSSMTKDTTKSKRDNGRIEVKKNVDEFLDIDLIESINTCIKEVEEENCNSLEEASTGDNTSEKAPEENEVLINKRNRGKTYSRRKKERVRISGNASDEGNNLKDIQADDIDLLINEHGNESKLENATNDINAEKNVPDENNDGIYNIEALISKKGTEYLVKWENYPEDQNTWEPQSSIPDEILEVRLNLIYF